MEVLCFCLMFFISATSFAEGKVTIDYFWKVLFLHQEHEVYTNRPLIGEVLGKMQQTYDIGFNICYRDKMFRPESEKSLSVYAATDHTLVDPSGLNGIYDDLAKAGQVNMLNKPGNYSVRLVSLKCYQESSVVLEYSQANIENIRLSNQFNQSVIDKVVYVPSIPFPYEPNMGNHESISVLLLGRKVQGRRLPVYTQILDKIMHLNQTATENPGDLLKNISNMSTMSAMPNHQLIHNNSYTDLEGFKALLDSSKILLNIHQSEFHHTLEEFHILPALLRGVIVVSEWVPLAYTFPLHEYVIFVPYNELAEKTMEVLANYAHYQDKFFGLHSKFNETMNKMKQNAFDDMERVVKTQLKKSL